jgi:hypothetical protein
VSAGWDTAYAARGERVDCETDAGALPQEFTDQSGKAIIPTHKPQGEPETLMLDGKARGAVVRPGSDDLNGWAVLLKESSAPLIDMRIACSPFSNCPAVLQNASEHHQYYDIGQVEEVLDR